MDSAELLLVSPPDYHTREFRGAQPLGIAYLAAALRQAMGQACQLLDANVGGPMPMEELSQRTHEFVQRSLDREGHPVVGMSVVTHALPAAVDLASRIKQAYPEVLIVFGGYHPTFAHREILEDFPVVDLCVRGEGEQTMIEIVEQWQEFWRRRETGSAGQEIEWTDILGVTWRRGGEIQVNPTRPNQADLDSLPFPARDLLPPLEAYPSYADTVARKLRRKASIISSRGCPFHCSFCSIISFYGDSGGKPWRGRSVGNVVAEMVHLAEVHGASHFEFQDDNFFVRPDRAVAIVEAFSRHGHDFSFAFLTRADQIVRGERFLPALRQTGLRYVSVGIESGSEASLERMVKQTTVATNRRALQILHDNDVAAQVEFIMFEPGTTLADLRENLRFIEEQGLLGYFPPLIFGSLWLLPGTTARAQAERDMGLQGSIHSTLAYEFSDPEVAGVYELLEAFQARLGDPWYRQAFQLVDGIPAYEIKLASREGNAGKQQALRRALGQLKLEFFVLARIPYTLLQDALDAAGGGEKLAADRLLAKAETTFRESVARVAAVQQSLAQD